MDLSKLPNINILKNSAKPLHGFKYNHAFDGHGLLNVYKINNGKFSYKGIRVQTHQYKIEHALNAQIFRGLNTNVPYNPLFINDYCNISVLVHNNEVQACSEGGMPYVIDVEEGKTVGPKHPCPLMPYTPLSAHPKVKDDNVYNMSCYIAGIALFDSNGVLFNEFFNGKCYYAHDFAITDNYYLIYLNEVNVNVFDIYSQKKTLLESVSLKGAHKILLVHKSTLERTYIDVPDGHTVLHISHTSETEKCITMYACFIPDDFEFSSVTNAYEFEHCYLHRIVINKNYGTCEVTKLIYTEYCEMPVYDKNTNSIFLI